MPNTFRLVLILLLSITFQYSIAQTKRTISGNVTDAKTGETLIGASIKISGGSTASGLTNAYGFYSLIIPVGKYEVAVSFIGYKTTVRQVEVSAKDLRLNVALEEDNQLNEVVISAIKKNENVSSPQMGLQKLSVREINDVPVLLGERDVLKTLQLLPGIKSAGEGNSGFYVRGGATDQNLILLDEAPVYNASHLLGFFPLSIPMRLRM